MEDALATIQDALAKPRETPSLKKRLLRLLQSIVAIFVFIIIILWSLVAPIVTGYSARIASTAYFVQKRSLDDIRAKDLGYIPFVRLSVNSEDTVLSASFGPKTQSASRRGVLGTVVTGGKAVMPEVFSAANLEWLGEGAKRAKSEAPWPEGEGPAKVAPELDEAALRSALDWAFSEPNPKATRQTRAIAIAWKGQLVAERYAPGFTAEVPLMGWSMTKSLVNALYGRLVALGKIDIKAPAPVAAWKGTDRQSITTDQLLRMSSGLKFSEEYFNPFGDAPNMLFVGDDAARFAINQPLEHEPDSHWSYASGTTNILCRILTDSLGGHPRDSWMFARRELFEKVGMNSAFIECDRSGTMVGSSFGYATARDWLRFGQLFLQDGVWKGERLLPEGWVKYSVTPTPAAPQGCYGAQWWLNAGSEGEGKNRRWPGVPADAYYASGFQSQGLIVIPSQQLVILRLGLTNDHNAWSHAELCTRVLAALPKSP
jgi:CubicO group peptidase (beta-lactamase class C family)